MLRTIPIRWRLAAAVAVSMAGLLVALGAFVYFQVDDELVPEELRGTGIRIEDDVLCTADGAVNLSAGLPRSPDEVETWLAAQRQLPYQPPA